jgi:dicarboxylate transporter 10
MTYSLARFAVYESVKANFGNDPLPFYQKILLSAFSGAFGGFIGQPADLVNVRMQNDMKLANDMRRNYKHALDGLIQISRNEGFSTLFNGVSMTMLRAALVTVGQLGCYDQIKQVLTTKFNAPDTVEVVRY